MSNNQGLNWNALFANGQIVQLTTTSWGANTKLRPADLGLDDTEAVKQALSLGRVRLMPTVSFKQIKRAVAEAKDAIDEHSINFAMIRGARYIPQTNIEKLSPKLIRSKNKFLEAVDAFCNGYQAARDAYMPTIRTALEATKASDAAIAHAYERLISFYPTSAEVRMKFTLSWSLYGISGARSQAAMAALSDEQTQVKSIVSGMVEELRGEVKTRVTQLLKATTRGGKLNKKMLEGSRNMIERLETLNILGDSSLNTQLAALKSAFDSMDENKMDEMFAADLSAIQSALETSAEQAISDVENNLMGTGRRRIG